MFLFEGYFSRTWHYFLSSLESYNFPLFQFCFQGQIYIIGKNKLVTIVNTHRNLFIAWESKTQSLMNVPNALSN